MPKTRCAGCRTSSRAAAANGWLDERACVMEALLSIKRAGADLVITYHAKDAVRWLQQEL